MSSRIPRALTSLRLPRRKTQAQPAEPLAPEVSMESRGGSMMAPVDESLIDAAIYRDGIRIESHPTLAETHERLRQLPGTVAWLGLYRPAPAQVMAAGEQ